MHCLACANCEDWENIVSSLCAAERLLSIIVLIGKDECAEVKDMRWFSSLLRNIDVQRFSQFARWLSSVICIEGPRHSRFVTVAREQSRALDLARDNYENLGEPILFSMKPFLMFI